MLHTDVTLITQREYIQPKVLDQYHQNILLEDRLLTEALTERGLSVCRVSWDDHSYDWSRTKCAVFRATWDYFHRINEFNKWLDRVKDQTLLINPFATVKWNMDKHYLQDMADLGVNIPETIFFKKGDHRTLAGIRLETGWDQLVIKPAISGAARHTYLIDSVNLGDHEATFAQLIANEDMLVQRFQPDVMNTGEWTFVVINGRYTHSILKRAKSGDFRVQDDFGGTVHDHTATEDEIKFAEHVMSLVSPLPVYGRVDAIRDVHGKMALQELELIEPELWFRNHPNAAARLADYLAVAVSKWEST
jgi:glutathione synthase/RimK-type ligase-like ATP-grasp enzyme